ncbi:tRNA threonylcarbamoyladenosine biosynthesis protein TsaB [Candidatus Liberibacter solanacearum]|uniref:tRNA (Adenosine(37)-N6)-threonylcarbamoyltransferase complex dimerization subunit type 1 TsaB n=1 Tax=Candidatus Liberibacter solanacearum TaxID=556287 RepID=A0A3R7NJH1_9HYPH|nr:tRNA (adenosine(37)-N6)-threonylcarbamoyltransferase complex dimerization subunit type 1 TsaB [Candidatus Liberibacter solanacearum]RPD37512.1 tRNA (adenosine(37)-N6)-threonylcarbamoyltransferase complex dimerization subunit type 1 TsaB [Candidatus Liberibacter solanacearum]
MIVLALDTTGVDCSVIVYDSNANYILGSYFKNLGRGHAEHLIPAIDCALRDSQLDISQIDRIVTALGPGSFTGVRVSIAVARGISLVLGKSAFGVGNLEVLARSHLDTHAGRPVMVLVSLLHKKICRQTFSVDGIPVSEPVLLNYEQTRFEVDNFEGEIIGSGFSVIKGIEGENDHLPMDVLARLGILKTGIAPAPIYLRSPCTL